MSTDISLAEILEIPKQRSEYGTGSITQRGSRWQISFYDGEGRRRRETFRTEAKARRALTAKLALKDAGKLDAAESRITADALAKLYLADRKGAKPKSYEWLASVWEKRLEPYFGGFMASRITTEKMIEYRNERLEAEDSPSTINKDLTVLRAIFNHGLDYTPPKVSRVPKFPEKLQEAPPRSGFITDKEYDALQEQAKEPWLRAFLALAYTYGFRRGELLGREQRQQPPMFVRQIDMKARTITLDVGRTKSGKGRTLAMTEEVFALLKPCVEGKKPDDPLFTWQNGDQVRDFRAMWRKITKAAGVPHLIVHDFRRSAARNLLRAGVSRDVARRITGHETDSMFSRYAIVEEADLMEAATKLEARRKQESRA